MNLNINNNTKISVSSNTFSVLYKHYKVFIPPFTAILVSFLLLIFFTIPTLQNYFTLQDQSKSEQQKLNTLKNNLNTLSNTDEGELNKSLAVLTSTLPTTKDFAGVINAISTAALPSGVAVGDFNFQVGDLSKTSIGVVGSYPRLEITVNVIGDFKSTIKYINELSKTAPISDITSIRTSLNSSTLTILFYFKPFLQTQINNQNPINPFSQNDLALIATLSKWNNVSSSPLTLPVAPSSENPTSSGSGDINQSPF